MRQSKSVILLHFAWATKDREPLLENLVFERRVLRCISSQARKMKCVVWAVNSMPDHVHLFLEIPTTLCAAEIAKNVKGTSSTAARAWSDESFDWQDGYGVFSVSPSHKNRVISYIKNQKIHHANGDLWPSLENTSEET